MDTFEQWLDRIGGLTGLATLALAVWHMLRSVGRPADRQTGSGARFLRAPILALATLLFVAAMTWLWRPLPLALPAARIATVSPGWTPPRHRM